MGLYVLWMVTTYMRPSEPLRIQRQDLVPPTAGVCREWCVLLFPETRAARSKVLAKNETVDLQTQIAPWLPGICKTLQQGTPSDRVFSFDYGQFLREWRRATRDWPMPIVPYQARHSGASMDAAAGHRHRQEIMDRGRWSSQSSLLRYEKHGRLAQSVANLTPAWRTFFEVAASRLEALFAGQVDPAVIERPPIRGKR